MKRDLGAYSLLILLVTGLIFGLQEEQVNAGSDGEENYSLIENEPNQGIRSESDRFKFLGQMGGTVKDVVVKGNYAYIGVGPRLVVLDVSDPITPTLVGQTEVLIPDSGNYYVGSLAASGNYVYALVGGTLNVIDITNPEIP